MNGDCSSGFRPWPSSGTGEAEAKGLAPKASTTAKNPRMAESTAVATGTSSGRLGAWTAMAEDAYREVSSVQKSRLPAMPAHSAASE